MQTPEAITNTFETPSPEWRHYPFGQPPDIVLDPAMNNQIERMGVGWRYRDCIPQFNQKLTDKCDGVNDTVGYEIGTIPACKGEIEAIIQVENNVASVGDPAGYHNAVVQIDGVPGLKIERKFEGLPGDDLRVSSIKFVGENIARAIRVVSPDGYSSNVGVTTVCRTPKLPVISTTLETTSSTTSTTSTTRPEVTVLVPTVLSRETTTVFPVTAARQNTTTSSRPTTSKEQTTTAPAETIVTLVTTVPPETIIPTDQDIPYTGAASGELLLTALTLTAVGTALVRAARRRKIVK
jgi:hypothetical protein